MSKTPGTAACGCAPGDGYFLVPDQKVPAKTDVKPTEAKSSVGPVKAASATPSLKLAGSVGKLALKPRKFTLPVSFTFTNTAGNVCAGVLPVDVTNSTEWTALTALYDEYRFVEGKLSWQLLLSTAAASGFTPADQMPVFAFDPMDNTALTSTRNGCEFAQSRLFATPNVSGCGGGLINGSALEFRWKTRPVASALSIDNSGNVTFTPGVWKKLPVAGSNAAYDGTLKFFCTNAQPNGTNFVAGIMWMTVEVRSRA